MLHMFCESYRQKAHQVDGASARRHRVRTKKPLSSSFSKGHKQTNTIRRMDPGRVLQILWESHSNLLAVYESRPTERNWANVIGAKRAYGEHKGRMVDLTK